MKVLVTGGAGFIGSAVCRHLVLEKNWETINVDKLTYAGNLSSLNSITDSPFKDLYHFEQADICDQHALEALLEKHHPDMIMHLAAESHVDRSIDGPEAFIDTNIKGTFCLLNTALKYYTNLTGTKKDRFRFHHISTDEVYGSLGAEGLFHEETPYDPRSPYSASKACSDHLVSAWYHTYGLPTIMTNCSNNYGPYHFPEKLIPLVILNALSGKPLPIYGKGDNVRDWLYVEDHAAALVHALEQGEKGQKYNIGGRNERTNLQVVESICSLLDDIRPRPEGSYKDLITFVQDRPGHDQRYAIDNSKIQNELKWEPKETFETGLAKTIHWYLENKWWWEPLQTAAQTRLGQTKSS